MTLPPTARQDTDGHNGVTKDVVCKSPAQPSWRVPTMEVDVRLGRIVALCRSSASYQGH
jgi:hypothetical protein